MTSGPVILVIHGSAHASIVEPHARTQSWLTIHVASAEAGYEIARREQPDVIAVDLSTSLGNAWTICRLLKADPRTAAIPVVVLGVDGRSETAAHARFAGVRAVLNQPLSADSLDLALRATLA